MVGFTWGVRKIELIRKKFFLFQWCDKCLNKRKT